MAFQSIAIIILLLFYGCYFLKMLAQRRKGIRTDQLGQGKVGFVRFVEVTMKLAAVLVFAVGLVSILAAWNQAPTAVRVLGAVISALGTAVFIAAVLTIRDSWRAGVSTTDKTALVTGGIYQISRNPAFLGFDLLYIGILLMFLNRVLLAATVFAVVMYHLQIVNVEEPFLQEAFGDDYLAYRNTVRRYLGRN
jgi:protein-S-isoprenylcysteine O-methyltransferase Ste14